MSIALCWVISLASYLFYLTKQKSVLNTWPKPNELSNLLDSFNDSLLLLTIIIPCLVFIISSNSKRNAVTLPKEETIWLTPVIITSFLWILVPLLFWILSHLTSLNLFVDRYFIPKEAALIFLVGFGLSFIFQKLPQQNEKTIAMLGTMVLALTLLSLSTKRFAFGLNKNTNYHHSLIVEESHPKSKQPIILEGDPKYFPNAYLGGNNYFFLIKDEDLIKTYNQFSKKINLFKI